MTRLRHQQLRNLVCKYLAERPMQTTDQLYEMVLERKSWAYLATKTRISGICTSDPRIEGIYEAVGPAGGRAKKKSWRLRSNHQTISNELEEKERKLGSRWKDKLERRNKARGTELARNKRHGSG